MFGRKGGSAVQELSPAITLEGPAAFCRILDGLNGDQTVNQRLSCEKSCLPSVVLMGPLPPQIQPAANADQRCHACIAERPVVLNCVGITREVPAQLSVCHQESSRHAAQGHKPR